MPHGKFCRCSHTERSHGTDGCQVIRYVEDGGKVHHCRCKLSAEQVRRNDDHLAVVLARRAERPSALA
jgi:hypothetical protein